MQQSWRQVGVDLKLDSVQIASMLEQAMQGEHDALLTSFGVGPDPDSSFFWKTGASYGWAAYYSNPEVDALLDAGASTFDQAQRKEIYAQVQAILAEDQPFTWICFPNMLDGVSDRVQGVDPTPFGELYWNMATWTVRGD